MTNIVNIKIKGIDPNRGPSVVNKNYIDIIFELSEKPQKNSVEYLMFIFQKLKIIYK